MGRSWLLGSSVVALRPVQVRAAALLRRGLTQREVARVVGRSERTIRNWLRDVEGFREATWPAGGPAGGLSAVGTLQSALAATRGDGSEDWRTRVLAAKALLGKDVEEPAVVSVPPGGVVFFPEAVEEVLVER